MKMNKEIIIKLVKNVILLLVADDFDAMKHYKMLGVGTTEEYRASLLSYLRGRESLILPPPEAFDDLDIFETEINIFETEIKNKWWVNFDLWTDRGLSDLTAQIYVWEEEDGTYHSMLYDIRVL